MTYARLYLDDSAKAACGWRAYLTISEGRKWVRLICTESAVSLRLSKTDYAAAVRCSKPIPLKRTRLAKSLLKVARDYGLEKSSGVIDALALLKGAA